MHVHCPECPAMIGADPNKMRLGKLGASLALRSCSALIAARRCCSASSALRFSSACCAALGWRSCLISCLHHFAVGFRLGRLTPFLQLKLSPLHALLYNMSNEHVAAHANEEQRSDVPPHPPTPAPAIGQLQPCRRAPRVIFRSALRHRDRNELAAPRWLGGAQAASGSRAAYSPWG